MSAIRSVLLALVLVLAGLPAAAGATSPRPATDVGATGGSASIHGPAATSMNGTTTPFVIRTVPNMTNYLDIEGAAVERGDYGRADLDVGSAVAMESAELHAEYDRRVFDAAYGNLTTEAERTRYLRATVSRLDARIQALDADQQRAISRYNSGIIGTETLLGELATVHVAAQEVAAQLESLQSSTGLALTEAVDLQINALEAELVGLRGPVTARAGAAVAGEQPVMNVYALTSSDAVVLSATDDRRTDREAFLPGDRDPSRPNQFVRTGDPGPGGINAAGERALELYPWIHTDTSPRSIQRFGNTSVYRFAFDHSHGRLVTYLDGGTESAFRERQRLWVGRLPVRTVSTNTTAAVELTVNRTYATGPMEVTATDPVTGQPVDATVVVDGYRVGSTGPDGSLWTISPYGNVVLEARVPSGNATVDFPAT